MATMPSDTRTFWVTVSSFEFPFLRTFVADVRSNQCVGSTCSKRTFCGPSVRPAISPETKQKRPSSSFNGQYHITERLESARNSAACLGNEIVVRIDDEKCSDLFINVRFAMFSFLFAGVYPQTL